MDQPAPPSPRPPLAFLAGAAVCAVLLATLAVRDPSHLGVDTAMYVAIGDRLAAGSVVYRDLFELNPPLIMWLNVVPSRLAAGLGASTFAVAGLGIYALIAASLLGSLALVGTRGARDDTGATTRTLRTGWAWAVLASAVATWVLDWGQREHLLFLAWAPFLALRWRRELADPVTPWVALPLGLLTGLVACLKPHFVAAIVGVEVVRAATRRDVRGLFAPETVGIALSGAAYGAALLSMPDDARHHLFDVLLPSVRDGYTHIASAWWRFPLGHLAAPLGVTAVAWATWRQRSADDPLAGLLTRAVLAATAMLLMYVAQGKNWPYHRIPVHGFTWLAVALLVARAVRHAQLTVRGSVALSVGVALLTGGLVARATVLSHLYQFPETRLTPFASARGLHDEPIAMFSTAPLVFMSTASLDLGTDRTFVWDYPVCLARTVDAEGHVVLPAEYAASLRADMTRTTARLVVVDTAEPCIYCADGVSMPRVLRESGAYAILEQRYTRLDDIGRFEVWAPQDTQAEAP